MKEIGIYQIYVKAMKEDGIGDLYKEYEELKSKLEKEGFFDAKHKRKIPFMPKTIGVLTSKTGSVIKDIINVSTRRNPNVHIRLFPVPVQGKGAELEIADAIRIMNEKKLADVLILARGGGSIEDLWPFNEEIVARAIYECSIPVISAVGHEVDFTIADFVADLRAPTPTGAAEMAVPQLSDMRNYLNQVNIRLNNTIMNMIKNDRRKLNDVMNRNVFKNPISIYQTKELKYDGLIERLKFSLTNLTSVKEKELIKVKNSYILRNPLKLVENKGNKYLQVLAKLEPLSPLKTIERGYSIVKRDGHVVTSITSVKKDDNLELNLKDGIIDVKVI